MTGTRVFESLNAEWALVCAQAGHAETVLGWLHQADVLTDHDQEQGAGLGEVLEELGRRDRARGRAHSDRWLRPLLERAGGEGAGAQLAARVVVQAMLPGAGRLAQRLRAGRDFDETGHVVVACLYQVVRRYPLWRSSGAAANLLLETLHLASRELAADTEPSSPAGGAVVVWWHPVLESDVVTAEPAPADPADAVWETVRGEQAATAGLLQDGETADGARGELAELLLWAVTCGQLPAQRARVIAAEARAGAREHAERTGVSAVTWRKRRSRTVRQLRTIATQWVQAA